MTPTMYKSTYDCSTGETTTVEYTAEEYAQWELDQAENDADLSDIRHNRNNLLATSDWTQGADAPLSDEEVAEWATYRQELRDFPAGKSKVSEFPVDETNGALIWPTPPS